MAKYSILHISDLHRSHTQPLRNTQLLESIFQDVEKNKNYFEEIKIIVVSGDLIQGSIEKDPIKAAKETVEQYEEVFKFLESLTNEVLNRKNGNLILVPGNHDIFRPNSVAAMRKVTEEEVSKNSSDYIAELRMVNSKIRWSWKDYTYYQIEDIPKYNKRLEYFKSLYDHWYSGERSFSLNPEEQFDVFDYPELDTTIIGLNSCYNNDHLLHCGEFCTDALASMNKTLRAIGLRPMRIGVWHHNTSGGPREDNYLHSHYLQNLLNYDFNIGLHGHQHETELINLNSKYSRNHKLVTVSAGSLCAGWNELPLGQTRQFNIIEIDSEVPKFRLFVRKHLTLYTDLPIWGCGGIGNEVKLADDVKFELNEGRAIRNIENEISNKIIDLVGQKMHLHAIELIDSQPDAETYRSFKIKCLRELKDNMKLSEYLKDTSKDDELLYLIESLRELNNRPKVIEIWSQVKLNRFKDNKLILQEIEKFTKWLGL